jgi:hypothetical protein
MVRRLIEEGSRTGEWDIKNDEIAAFDLSGIPHLLR